MSPDCADALTVLGTVIIEDASHVTAPTPAFVRSMREARGYLEKAIAADPTNPMARLQLMMCLLGIGDAPGAKKQAQEFLRVAPGHEMAPHVRQVLKQMERDGL